MALMHERETFQKLADLLCSAAPNRRSKLLSIYLFHDDAMKLSCFYKESLDGEWTRLNLGRVGFDVMDWWEAYHAFVKEADGSEFKFGKAEVDQDGDLQMQLSYEVIDPLGDDDVLKIAALIREGR